MIVHNKHIIVVIALLIWIQPSLLEPVMSDTDRLCIPNQDSQVGCNITYFDIDLFTSDSDLIVDIYYQIVYNTSVQQIEIRLNLKLDNDSYVRGFTHMYDPSFLDETIIEAFFSYSNAVGDPLPFDVQTGQTLYAYIEVETNYGIIQSNVVSEIIPIDVTRPWFFNIPAPLFIIAGIMFSIAPCLIIGFVIHSYNKRRRAPHH
jgi:hypothetical protein